MLLFFIWNWSSSLPSPSHLCHYRDAQIEQGQNSIHLMHGPELCLILTWAGYPFQLPLCNGLMKSFLSTDNIAYTSLKRARRTIDKSYMLVSKPCQILYTSV